MLYCTNFGKTVTGLEIIETRMIIFKTKEGAYTPFLEDDILIK